MDNPKGAESLRSETNESNVAAKFDLETPPGSAKAEAVSTPFTAEESAFIKDIDNLATISLDIPSASDSHSAFQEHPAQLTSQQDSEVAVGQSVSAQGLPAAAASSVPLSSYLSSFRGSEQVSEAVLAAATPSSSVVLTEAPASHSRPPPDLPKASPVKVWVKDPEKVTGKLLASHISCSVRTECSRDCALAAEAATAGTTAAAGPGPAEPTAAAATGTAEGADGGSPSKQAKQQQQQPVPEGAVVFEVRRRFDDFELLSRLLKAHYRGYFIPRLPPSEWLSGGDNYLRTRKVDLQDYLGQVVNHPVLQGSEELRLFLTAAGDLAACSRWQRMVQRPAPMDALLGIRRAEASSGDSSSASSSAPAAGSSSASSVAPGSAMSGGGWGMMSRMRQSIMHVVQPKAQAELPTDEQQLRQAKEWFKELQQHLNSCVTVVRSLVHHMEALCEDFGELGRSLSHFARFEEGMAARQGQYTTAGSTAVQRGADLQKLGYGALRQHSLSKQFVVSAGASLVFLPDYYALIPECVGTLQEREDAWEGVTGLVEQLREKQDAATKLAAALGPSAQADKRTVSLRTTIHALQDKLLAAEQQYKLLKERNQQELGRLNLQRAEDFHRALGRFAALQAQAATAAADIWKGVADQFSS